MPENAKSQPSQKNIDGPLMSGKITFVADRIPAMQAGEYQITVTQHLTSTSASFDETYQNKKTFAVRGERFSLDPADVDNVFPPKNSQGEYDNVLPHIVLKKKCLPWTRSPDGTDAGKSWLALLVFHQDDPLPKLQDVMVGDLQSERFKLKDGTYQKSNLPADTVSYPDLDASESVGRNGLNCGEQWFDPCQVVDVPVSLFNAIAPALSSDPDKQGDLHLLAHAREVELDGETSADECSVVVANRLPAPNAHNAHNAPSPCTVHLVSVANLANWGKQKGEELKGYLPSVENGSYKGGDFPAGTENIRLVSLKRWSFTSVDPEKTFQQLLKNLNTASFAIPNQSTPSTDAEKTVAKAFEMGYTAINHHTRQADNTVSWYRGPFLPFAAPSVFEPLPDPATGQEQEPLTTADQALRYNPDTGMMDVTYAAAWQIGRLLALRNKPFSIALYNWKRASAEKTVLAAEQQILAEKLEVPTKTPAPVYRRVTALVEDPGRLAAVHEDDPVPPPVTAFLEQLKLLEGVPFNYLVPDDSFLPRESIRFFQLDFNWISALVEGAFSLGSATTADLAHDAVLVPKAQAAAGTSPAPDQASGLLLRSQVVPGWPHLGIKAYDSSGVVLTKVLRMERLSPTTLLYLVEGLIDKVIIHEKPKGLHFGVDYSSSKPKTKTLRYITVPHSAPAGTRPGDEINGGGVNCTVPNRDQPTVVAISKLASNIESQLEAYGANAVSNGKAVFTAAEFGLELTEGVQSVSFQTKNQDGENP